VRVWAGVPVVMVCMVMTPERCGINPRPTSQWGGGTV